jgi:hypothetical protein
MWEVSGSNPIGDIAFFGDKKKYALLLHLLSQTFEGAQVAQWVRSLDLTTHTSLSPLWRGFAPGFVNYKKGCTRLASASDKVYQLLAHGRWFSPGTPASSTTKTGRHNIAEILLKVALKHQNQSNFWKTMQYTFCGNSKYNYSYKYNQDNFNVKMHVTFDKVQILSDC